jgi:hypothetical protein
MIINVHYNFEVWQLIFTLWLKTPHHLFHENIDSEFLFLIIKIYFQNLFYSDFIRLFFPRSEDKVTKQKFPNQIFFLKILSFFLSIFSRAKTSKVRLTKWFQNQRKKKTIKFIQVVGGFIQKEKLDYVFCQKNLFELWHSLMLFKTVH